MIISNSQSYKKGIVISTVYNILAKGMFFANILSIAYCFGSGINTDLYFFITSMLILAGNYINGVDLMVIIPESMRLREHNGFKTENRFLNFFILLYFTIGVGVGLIVFILGPVPFYQLISKFSVVTLNNNNALLVLSTLILPCQLVTSLLTAILTSHKYFTAPMVVSLVNNTLTILLLFLLRAQIGITASMVALLAGYIINLVWLLWLMKSKLGWQFFLKIKMPTKAVILDLILMEANILPVSLRGYIVVFLLSGLGAGIITSVNFGQQIAFIPEVFIISQVVSVMGIKMSELTAQKQLENLGALYQTIMHLLFFLLTPVACLMMLYSNEIVEIIFFKNNYDVATKGITATVLFFMAAILPIKALDALVTRLITSQQKLKNSFLYGTIMHLLIALLVYFCIKRYGLYGFLGSTLFAYFIIIPLIFYFLCKKIAPFINYTDIIIDGLRIVLYNIIIAIVILIINRFILYNTSSIIRVIAGTSIYFVLLFISNHYINYSAYVKGMVKKIIKSNR